MNLTRFGIKPKENESISSYYKDIASLKSSSIFIENTALGESINDFINSNIMVTRAEDNNKNRKLGKVKGGFKNIIDKIIAFFVGVKNFFVKTIKRVKEFLFGKKVENVKKKVEKFNKETKTTKPTQPMALDRYFEFPEILIAGSLEELKNKYEKTNAGEELLSVLKSFRTEVNSYMNDHRNAANKRDGRSTDRRRESVTKIADSFKNSFDKFQKSLDILKTISSKIDQNAKMVKLSFTKDREKIELTKANIGNTILLIDNVRKIVDILEKDGIEDLNSTISKLNALKKVAIEQNYDWTSSYGDMYNKATKFVNHLIGNMNQMISLTNSIVTSLDHVLIKNTMNLSEVSPDGYMKIDRRTF
nr:MAG TPA: hypothetical protein [Caudoviricetes sp.]